MGFRDKLKNIFGPDDAEGNRSVSLTENEKFDEDIPEEHIGEPLDVEEIIGDSSDVDEKGIDEAADTRNFRYLDDLIHIGVKEIALDCDITLGDGEESDYSAGIRLDIDDLVIDGKSHTIDAKEKTRIFRCTGKNITLKNFTFKNGFHEKTAGAVFNNEGELCIEGSIFTENSVEGVGGAIRNVKGKLTVKGSTFSKNTAEYAGAIGNYYGELTVEDSTFTENDVEKNDGTVRNWSGELNIFNSTFSKNRHTSIYNIGGKTTVQDSTFGQNDARAITIHSGNLIIMGSTFARNTMDDNGGAIFNIGGELDISNSTFTENIAKWGGAIYNRGNLTCTGSTFTENIARLDGAIDNSGRMNILNCEISNNESPESILSNAGFLEADNVKFIANRSKHVLSNHYEKFNISIIGGKFAENTVEEAAILNKGQSCTIQKTVFEDNSGRENSDDIINCTDLTLIGPDIRDSGKTILNEGHMSILQAPGLENKIHGDGTVETDGYPYGKKFDFGYLDEEIHKRDADVITLNHDICLENYERLFYEGGIELDIDNLVIDGMGHTIDGNDKSRIFIITGNDITLKNIIFKNAHQPDTHYNTFNISGGAIKVNGNKNLNVENCEFINNVSERNGGAIRSTGGKLCISDSKFLQMDGGAIDIFGGELNISDSTFMQITGRAIGNAGGKSSISCSTFTENQVRAIDNSRGEMNISDSTFSNNADGAIRNSDGKLIISDSQFTENESQGDSGVIHSYDGNLRILDSTFTQNHAEGDGGTILNYQGTLSIFDSTFAENTANGSGGSIRNDEGDLNISNSTFTQNRAGKLGGVIYNTGGELNITDSRFDENNANGGGAINNYFGELNVSDSTFMQNASQNDGGAICNGGELTIKDSTFSKNMADNDGDDIFNHGRIFGMEDISEIMRIHNDKEGKFYQLKSLKECQKDFTYLNDLINSKTNEIKLEYDVLLDASNKEHKAYGEGIKVDRDDFIIDGNGHVVDAQGLTRIFEFTGKNIEIRNIVLKNGFTRFRGGAIHNDGDGLTIVESTFAENTADDGGALYNGQGNMSIIGSEFIKNAANKFGGAIQHYDGELNIKESKFEANAANSSGGAIHNIGGRLSVTDSTFDSNKAEWDDGAIFNVNEKEFNIVNCELKNNNP